MIEAMTSGIHERGKGQRGDKTMLDAWLPATEDAMKALSNGAYALDTWTHLTDAAAAGANATRSMVAARGRAARLGERSLGRTDPGAASAVIILQAMMKSLVDAPIAEDTHFLTFSVNTLPDLLPCAKIPSRCAGPRRKRCCERKSRLIDAFSQR